jgi:hypothetical protein
MKSYDALNSYIAQLNVQMAKEKKREGTRTLIRLKELCNELCLNVEMLTGVLIKGWMK